MFVRSLTASLSLLVLAPALSAQSGQEVFERAVAEYEQRMQGIETYTVTQDFMGFQSTVRWERLAGRDRQFFAPRRSQTLVEPGSIVGEGADHLGQSAWEDPFQHFLDWGQSATLEGRDVIDGVGVLVVRVDDFEGAEFGLTPGTFAEGHFRPAIGRFYLDPDQYLLRRIDAEGTLTYAGTARDGRIIADFQDYREESGVLHPFVIRLDARGVAAGSGERQREARAELEELTAQLDSLPERQRSSLESLMSVQIDRLRQIAEGQLLLTVRTLSVASTARPED